jgi:GR25 family glycosyltransferase involved in LPS biosynthesis
MVCIIAIGGEPRNSRLPMQVKAALPDSDVFLIDAITPSLISTSELLNLVDKSSTLLGRKIGEREIAVMLSHRKCYDFFQESENEYLLVLEDDVVLNNALVKCSDIVNLMQRQKPIIISLYSPKWSIWKRTHFGLQAKIPPAYAAAYFINKESIRLALASNPLGLADWPPWAIKIRFYLRDYFSIECLENNSFLENSRIYNKKNKMKYVLLKSLKNDMKKSWQIRYIIIYPLKWKIYKFMRFIFSSKSGDKRIESWV